MIQLSTIEKLKTYNDSPFQILSVYLGADSLQAPTGELLATEFHALLHQHFDKELRATFASDIKRIEQYLNDYKPLARTLAFFSAGHHLWEIASLEFSLPTGLYVSTSPDLDPIVQSLQKYTKYLVLLVDREKARMFTVEQGEIIDHSEFTDYVPPRIKTAGKDGGTGDNHFRHNEVLLKRHIDRAALAIAKFTENNDIHFVILGGHAEMFRKVAESLSSNLRAKIVGNFVSEVDLPLNEILLESKKIAGMVA